MSCLFDTTNIRRAVAADLRRPAFEDAMETLSAPATRRYVARFVPAADVEDVLADAGLRLWSALGRSIPDNGAAFTTALVKVAIAQHHRVASRRVATSPMTTGDGADVDHADPSAVRALDRLIEGDAVRDLLTHLERRGATPRELQRLVALGLADGNPREAVTYLPLPCRPGTLNQSMTSLRKRAAA